MSKLKMHSPNLTQDNIARIRELFPGCVTEARDEDGSVRLAVDFDQLKQELAESIVEGPQERYHLNWPGKREALLTANAPIAKTLRPCRAESVDFDTTRNLFIEGDNLDALKLLQETYLGKVKMIYIDPPYNTGNDFIYKDNFAEGTGTFLERTNQKDEEGNRLVANKEANGRFHSDWLSMIYPRLKLARNLLRDDGVIFISIDDGEQANLKALCDLVFGRRNFVSNVVWHNSSRVNDYVAIEHEYVLIYTKNLISHGNWKKKRKEAVDILYGVQEIKASGGTIDEGVKFIKERIEHYKKQDKKNKTKSYSWLGNYTSIDENWQVYYAVDLTGEGSGPPRKFGNKVIPAPEGRHWMGQEYINKLFKEGRIVWRNHRAYRKLYIQESEENLKSIIFIPTRRGSEYLKNILGKDIFDKPKPHDLVKHFAKYIVGKDDKVLDFFAGSATTAHAVMQLNAEDGGNRQFIMVQLPEPCNEKSEAFKAGYQHITEISKERIRRAGQKIKETLQAKTEKEQQSPKLSDGEGHPPTSTTPAPLDIGFRTLKIDSSNMADVYYTPDATPQEQLAGLTDNIKPDRTAEDLLFQVLLDWGVDLALPIRSESIQDKTVFFIDENALIACFDDGVDEKLVKTLAGHKPMRVVFRDTGFTSDAVKINVEQIFRQLSPGTEVRSL